jgi:hypothetical protein
MVVKSWFPVWVPLLCHHIIVKNTSMDLCMRHYVTPRSFTLPVQGRLAHFDLGKSLSKERPTECRQKGSARSQHDGRVT